MNKVIFPSKIYWVGFVAIVLLASCKDDDDDVQLNDGSDQTINTWVYDVMKEVYYWTDYLPTEVNKDLDPMYFFETLRYKDDRFSVIVPDFEELNNALNGVYKEAGYEFVLSRVSMENEDVVGIVLYVKPNSPAYDAGLLRGDVFEQINGQSINLSNYVDLVGDLSSSHSLLFSRQNDESGEFEIQPVVSLNVVELAENPNYLDTVYTIDGHKIGYYVYNFFASGVNAEEYDDEMDAIFADFKGQGITDLVLDLRYNSGGAISSATNLASLAGKNVGPDKVFYENKWNDFYQDYWDAADLTETFLEKNENVGNSLNPGRVYVLIGSRTASASELIINGLNPYMDVYMIGDTTVGKNVGSVPIEDDKNEANPYGLLPIAFKIFNSDGNSDYDRGFAPHTYVDDFVLPMKPLGDIEESLLATAIAQITGAGDTTGRFKRDDDAAEKREVIMSSIDKKIRTNKVIMEMPVRQF